MVKVKKRKKTAEIGRIQARLQISERIYKVLLNKALEF